MGKAVVFNCSGGDYAFAMIPKCGQHTLLYYGGNPVDAGSIVGNVDRSIAFVREPVERLHSAYRFFRQNSCYSMCDFMGSYEDFIDWALNSVDEHVIPQSNFLHNCYNEFMHLDKMTSFLSGITGRVIEPKNKTDKDVLFDTAYRLKDIKKRYSEDYKIFEALS